MTPRSEWPNALVTTKAKDEMELFDMQREIGKLKGALKRIARFDLHSNDNSKTALYVEHLKKIAREALEAKE